MGGFVEYIPVGTGGGGAPSSPMTELRYKRGTAQVITPDLAQTYVYNELDYDVRGDFNPATGVFIAPDSGSYVISAGIASLDTWTAGEVCTLELHVNGALVDYLDKRECEVTGTAGFALNGTSTIQLTQGDEVEIQIYHNRGIDLNTLANGASMTDGQYNYFEVTQVVNTTNTSQNSAALVASVDTLIDHDQVNIKAVKEPADLSGTLDSSIVYFITGVIDFTGSGIQIEVPAGGLSLRGHNFDISKLICNDENFKLFTSPVGGSGNVLGTDYAIEVTGTNSQVYDLTSATGAEAFEFSRINYNNCTSLGEINNYRQGFETGTGRFGGSPNLILSGLWLGGYFIDSCIVRGLDAGMTGALFEAGTGFQMNSRFRSNMNTDLPALAAYCDFDPSQFPNPSTVQMTGAIITRNGAQDANDANLFPNMLASDLSAQWIDNVGLDNTYVGGKVTNVLESSTTISVQGDYYDISGASLPSQLEHFDSPAAFQLRHLGNNPRDYTVYVDAIVDGQQNAELAMKIEKWDDSAGSFVDVTIQRRQVNNLLGGRDVAIFNIWIPVQLDQNDYVKWQIANLTGTQDVTLELDSYFVVSER